MTQVFNFSAGPAVLPKEVLQQAAGEMLDWHGSGMSVMEMSHRGPEFISIYQQAESDLRELLAVPPNYKILFMQGGGLGQNAIIPMNLAGCCAQPATIDFVHTGSWSGKSIKEAKRYANVNVAASGEAEGFTKTVFDAKTGELLGAHMAGPEVTEMIQGYTVARTLETTEAELMHTVFPHPTVSEAMHEAVLDAYGRVIHI